MPYETDRRAERTFRAWLSAGLLIGGAGGVMLARADLESLAGISQGIAGLALLVAGALLLRHGWNSIGSNSD